METAALIDFGTWVIVDNNTEDQRQVVDYDVLQDTYTLDKNGKWEYIPANRIIIDFRYS